MANQKIDKKINKTVSYFKTGIIAVIVVFAFYLTLRFVVMRTTVDGSSMYPTLTNGDKILVDKLSYRFSEPKRYDIIVFEEDISASGYFIKRVIGLPGETIHIDENGIIYANGKPVADSYGYGLILNRGMAQNDIVINSGEFFVLGDNRNNSEDSRFGAVGNVGKSRIFGRAILRVTPLEKFGYIDLYRERKEEESLDDRSADIEDLFVIKNVGINK